MKAFPRVHTNFANLPWLKLLLVDICMNTGLRNHVFNYGFKLNKPKPPSKLTHRLSLLIDQSTVLKGVCILYFSGVPLASRRLHIKFVETYCFKILDHHGRAYSIFGA